MSPVHYSLAVVASADGFIAKAKDHAPQDWASPEEQTLFFKAVDAADWAIMGRHTHEAADKPHRRRIVLSTRTNGWQRPTQLWLDPDGLSPRDLAARVADVHPLGRGLVLGGTRVHDWFHRANALDLVLLTIEPARFGQGLPIFSDQRHKDPTSVFTSRGYHVRSERRLNPNGTRLLTLTRR
ncbi:MAG: dihydrofolate reductase family protein [Pseudomonadota bacterium]